jgi:hypothetical protein
MEQGYAAIETKDWEHLGRHRQCGACQHDLAVQFIVGSFLALPRGGYAGPLRFTSGATETLG